MSTWGDEPTRPAGGTQGGVPGADPTMPATRAGGYGGPDGPDDGGYDGDDEWEERDRRKLWMIVGGVLVLGLLIGALIAILASGGDDGKKHSTTTTTATTSTTTTSTTSTTAPTTTTAPPTTAAPGPQITQFVNQSSTPTCPGTTQITLKWATQNTTDVTISIDNPNGPYGNYPSSGQADVPFACGADPTTSHTYFLTANGTNGQKPQQQITVTSSP